MNTMKKILSCLLLVCVLACLLPAGAAFAVDPCTTHTWVAQADGTSKCSVCQSVCGDSTTAHSFGEMTGGVKTCSNCGYKCGDTDTLHKWVESNGVRTCSVCGYACGASATPHTDTDSNGVCDLCGQTLNVAEIGSNKYTTLAAAIEAVGSGETIKLLSNITGTGLTTDKSFILNMDGKTYTVVGAAGFAFSGAVTVQSGTIASTTATTLVSASAGLTLTGVTLNAGTEKTLDCTGSGITYVLDGSTAITGKIGLASGNSTINVASATLDNATLDTGLFRDGDNIVRAAAKIGTTYYGTLDEAFTAVTDGTTATITVLGGGTLSAQTISGGKNITLALNGKTVTGDAETLVTVTDGSFSVDGGTLTTTGATAISIAAADSKTATVTVGSGATTGAVSVANSGSTLSSSGILGGISQTGGTVNVTGGQSGSVSVGGGTANVSGGTVSSLTSTGGTSNVTSGTVNSVAITGGTVKVSGGSVANGVEVSDAGALEVSGTAAITGDTAVYHHGGTVKIMGGTVGGGSVTNGLACSGGTADVTGGTVQGTTSIAQSGSGTVNVNSSATLIGAITGNVNFTGGAVITKNVNNNADAVAGTVQKGAKNIVVVGGSDADVSLKLLKSDLTNASASSSSVLVMRTSLGELTFNNAALKAISDSITGDTVQLRIVKATSSTIDTFSLTVSNSAGAVLSNFTSSVDVVLNGYDSIPSQIDHKKNGAVYKTYTEGGANKFVYYPDTDTVALTIDGFSDLAVTKTAPVTFAITTDAALPTGVSNNAYSKTLETNATTGTVTWSVDAATLPNGLNLAAANGILSGTPTAVFNGSFTVTATHSSGSTATKSFTMQVLDAVAAVVHNGTTTTKNSLTQAMADAVDGDSVVLYANITDAVEVTKGITFDAGGHSTGTINVHGATTRPVTVRNASAGTINVYSTSQGVALTNVVASLVSVGESCNVTINGGNTVVTKVDSKKATSAGAIDAYVQIEDGRYNTLAGAGDYAVVGGVYDGQVPVDYCGRYRDANGTVHQYYSYYSSGDRKWHITQPFVPEVTKVNNSAYYVMRSDKTLSFTTNMPYDPMASDITELRYEAGNSESRIASNKGYYTITSDNNGYTVVTLSNKFLRLLGERKYVLSIVTDMGTADAYFHVSTVGKTGDTSNIGLWAGIMGGAVVVLGGIAFYLVRKSKKKK